MKTGLARLVRVAGVAATALALTGAVAGTAAAVTFIGQDVPTTVTIARGTTGMVPWTYKNTGGPGILPASGVQVVFTAPGATTFTAQASAPSQYSSDGTTWVNNNLGLRNCTLSNSATTLTCEGYGLNGGRSSWPSGGYFRFWPQVAVAAGAPAGTTLPQGGGTLSYTDPGSGTYYTIANGTLNVATPATGAATPMCLDAGNTRNNGDGVIIWQCASTPGGNTNQNWVVRDGSIVVKDTVGTSTPMCLDAGNTRNNGDKVTIWQCASTPGGNTNQNWIVQDGTIIVKDTVGTSRPMCLDIGNTRNNGDRATIWQCASTPGTNTNQLFVVQRGSIKVEDTLS